MRDIVLIPTFSRPEMLWHCLEHLSVAESIADYEVRVLLDFHRDRKPPPAAEVEQVVARFPIVTKLIRRDPHSFHGNSYNVLQGYKEALAAEHVYLVEDDVLVEPDFFLWHRQQQGNGAFCSVAVRNERSGLLKSDRDYASLGVCFPRASVQHIVKHARSDYYRDQQGYIARTFDGRFGNEFHEQDGLILRVMGSIGGYSIWPLEPKARHVGTYGYNAGNEHRPLGSLLERYRIIKQRISCP